MKLQKAKHLPIIIICLLFASNTFLFFYTTDSSLNSFPSIDNPKPNFISTNSTELYAIIVGVTSYPDPNNIRPFSDLDAQSFYSSLINNYGINPEKISLLINSNATYQNIISAFDSFSPLIDGNDKFMFFFSGSGLVDDPPTQNFSVNIQTLHDYNPNTNQKWSINHTNSHAIRVHFSQFNTEFGLDTLYISDSEGVSPVNYEKRYSGDLGSDFWSEFIPTTSDSIHLQFTSISAIKNYAFQIDK